MSQRQCGPLCESGVVGDEYFSYDICVSQSTTVFHLGFPRNSLCFVIGRQRGMQVAYVSEQIKLCKLV